MCLSQGPATRGEVRVEDEGRSCRCYARAADVFWPEPNERGTATDWSIRSKVTDSKKLASDVTPPHQERG
jgi:hypothetical protein